MNPWFESDTLARSHTIDPPPPEATSFMPRALKWLMWAVVIGVAAWLLLVRWWVGAGMSVT